LSENDKILLYGAAISKAYENFLKGVEKGDIVYTNEQEIRCFLFMEYISYLREEKFPKPYHIFVDYKIDDKIIDMAVPIDEKKVMAIEIKYNPSPAGVVEDLTKLKELINKNIALRGVFMTFALRDYKLRDRLKERGIFSKFSLKEEGESDSGSVSWQTIESPYDHKSIDALFIVLWKK